MVNDRGEAGKRLVEALSTTGYLVELAFWAKPTEEGRWFLYLASRLVDEKGPAEGYRLVLGFLRDNPNPWIEPLDVRVLGLEDSMTKAVLARAKPRMSSLKPYPGMTRFDDVYLAGVSMDGALVYPLVPAA
ncbi:MAG: hypothetical protein K2W96_17360 [Gemmataceae bacterium]|nr:hypothetical protein [Gemmataceae bacterium]